MKALQKHFKTLEALALDRDEPEEVIDYTGKQNKPFGSLLFPCLVGHQVVCYTFALSCNAPPVSCYFEGGVLCEKPNNAV